jgi:hypothetical protein
VSGDQRTTLPPGAAVRVRLLKQSGTTIEYPAEVLADDGNHLVVRGPWAEMEPRDLGFVTFERGDVFTEHYWRDRWYSVKEVRDADDRRKGWYCDVARPVRVEDTTVISEDLILDLWATDDGTILRLDEAELAASGLAQAEPEVAARASVTLDELERLARDGFRGLW